MRPWIAVIAVLAAIGQVGLASTLPGGPRSLAILPAVALAVLLAAAGLCRFEWFLVGLLVLRPLLDIFKGSGPALAQPTVLLSVLLLLVGPLWLVAQRRHSGPLPLTALTAATGAFVASSALSALGATDVAEAGSHVVRAASWWVMFLVVRRLAGQRKTAIIILAALAASVLIPALVSVVEIATPVTGPFVEVKDGVERLRATFDQSNNFARYLMLVILVAVPSFSLVGRRGRVLLAAGILALLPLLFLTYARSAWIGLLVGVAAISWAAGRRRLVAGGVVLGVAMLAVPGLLGGLAGIARPTTQDPASDNDSLSWRVDYWAEISSLALRQPLTGIGPNGTVGATVDGKEPHNEYLRAMIEGGAIGFVAYLTLLAVAVVVAIGVCRRAGSMYEKAIGLSGLGVMTAVVVAGAASNIVHSVSFMWYLALVLALIDQVARSQVSRHPAAEEA